MDDRILYAGDDHLAGAAAYLAGVLTHAGLAFDHVRGDAPLPRVPADAEPRLYILSDYPVKNLSHSASHRIMDAVEAGAGLLMIGGWESFHGACGEYHASPLAALLPVVLQASDDRVNVPQLCLVEKCGEHAILEGLPLDHPPSIGGYNRVRARAGAEVLLAARHVAVEMHRREAPESAGGAAATWSFTPGEASPLLVVGRHGRGRVAAFTSDVAPHWVGGFVDWGPERVRARAPGAEPVEVGSHYARFFTRLVRWTMGALPAPS